VRSQAQCGADAGRNADEISTSDHVDGISGGGDCGREMRRADRQENTVGEGRVLGLARRIADGRWYPMLASAPGCILP
jgi:hypothetical protein